MSALTPPPARHASWLKPVLIIITIIMLIIGLGIASLVGLGWYGWNTVQKSIAAHSSPQRQLTADEKAIIAMVLEREVGEPGTHASTSSSEPELEVLTDVLAAHYQRALANHADGNDRPSVQQDSLQQALALISSAMQDTSNVGNEEAALSPELELLLEALDAHQQRKHKKHTSGNAP